MQVPAHLSLLLGAGVIGCLACSAPGAGTDPLPSSATGSAPKQGPASRPDLSDAPLAPDSAADEVVRVLMVVDGGGQCELVCRQGGSTISIEPILAAIGPVQRVSLECSSGGHFRIQAIAAMDESRLFVMGTASDGSQGILGIATLAYPPRPEGCASVELLYWGDGVSGFGDCDWLPAFPWNVVVLDTSRPALHYFSLETQELMRVADHDLVEDLEIYTSLGLFRGQEGESETYDVLLIRLYNQSSAPVYLARPNDVARWLWDVDVDGVIDVVD